MTNKMTRISLLSLGRKASKIVKIESFSDQKLKKVLYRFAVSFITSPYHLSCNVQWNPAITKCHGLTAGFVSTYFTVILPGFQMLFVLTGSSL